MSTPVSYSHAIKTGAQIEHVHKQSTYFNNYMQAKYRLADQRVIFIFSTSCYIKLTHDDPQSNLHSKTFFLSDISNRTQYFQDLILLLANDTNWQKHPRCPLLNIPIINFTFSQLFPGHDQNHSILIKSFNLFFSILLGLQKLTSHSLDPDAIPLFLSVVYLAELFGERSIIEEADKQLSCKGIELTSIDEAVELTRCAKLLRLSKLLSNASKQYFQISIKPSGKNIVSYESVIEKYYPINGTFITELDLSSFQWLTNSLLAQILKSTENLKTLVTGRANLTYAGVNLPKALEELNVSENVVIQSENLFALICSETKIKKLHLNNTKLNLKNGQLPESLQKLHISHTPITTKSLSSALKISKNLEVLDISGCAIDLSEITPDELPCLGNLLQLECRFNQKLDNPCRVDKLQNFFSLAQSLKLLDLSNSNALLKGITLPKTLKELFIYNCKNISQEFLDNAAKDYPELKIEK